MPANDSSKPNYAAQPLLDAMDVLLRWSSGGSDADYIKETQAQIATYARLKDALETDKNKPYRMSNDTIMQILESCFKIAKKIPREELAAYSEGTPVDSTNDVIKNIHFLREQVIQLANEHQPPNVKIKARRQVEEMRMVNNKIRRLGEYLKGTTKGIHGAMLKTYVSEVRMPYSDKYWEDDPQNEPPREEAPVVKFQLEPSDEKPSHTERFQRTDRKKKPSEEPSLF